MSNVKWAELFCIYFIEFLAHFFLLLGHFLFVFFFFLTKKKKKKKKQPKMDSALST